MTRIALLFVVVLLGEGSVTQRVTSAAVVDVAAGTNGNEIQVA
jgi:hypothetical protein